MLKLTAIDTSCPDRESGDSDCSHHQAHCPQYQSQSLSSHPPPPLGPHPPPPLLAAHASHKCWALSPKIPEAQLSSVLNSVAEPTLFNYGSRSGSTFYFILAPAPAPALYCHLSLQKWEIFLSCGRNYPVVDIYPGILQAHDSIVKYRYLLKRFRLRSRGAGAEKANDGSGSGTQN